MCLVFQLVILHSQLVTNLYSLAECEAVRFAHWAASQRHREVDGVHKASLIRIDLTMSLMMWNLEKLVAVDIPLRAKYIRTMFAEITWLLISLLPVISWMWGLPPLSSGGLWGERRYERGERRYERGEM